VFWAGSGRSRVDPGGTSLLIPGEGRLTFVVERVRDGEDDERGVDRVVGDLHTSRTSRNIGL